MNENYPWKNPIKSTDLFDVYLDSFPVADGHLLYVPYVDNSDVVKKCLDAAYDYGIAQVKAGVWDGFNIGLNNGECAGQTCSWSHVHLIPRMKDDCDEPIGGVRGVMPGRRNYKTEDYYIKHRTQIYGNKTC